MKNLYKTVQEAIKNLKNWMNDPFFNDVYEALRCPDPGEINRIYDRKH